MLHAFSFVRQVKTGKIWNITHSAIGATASINSVDILYLGDVIKMRRTNMLTSYWLTVWKQSAL
jgi:hypothetical protein